MINKIIILLIALSLTIFLWLSCHKEEISCLACEPCEEFVSKSIVKAVDILPDQELTPCFNPNNSNEFIYVKERNNKYSLVKYELAEAKETVIFDKFDDLSKPIWGKNNYLVFMDGLHKINIYDLAKKKFSVYENNDFAYRFPRWKNDSILAVNASTDFSALNYYAEINIKTEKQDTIKADFQEFDLNEKGEPCFYIDGLLKYKQGEKAIDLFKNHSGVSFFYFAWYPNNNDIYYTTSEGLFKVDKDSKKIIQIKKSCTSKYYKSFSISPDGKTILIEKMNISQNSDDLLPQYDTSLWIMNIDGSEERQIVK